MAKRAPLFEKKLARIATIKRDCPSSAGEELRGFLHEPESYLVAQAVEAIAALGFDNLISELVEAFHRFRLGTQKDSGLLISVKIIETLAAFEADAKDVYLLGLATVQIEGTIDRAVGLRIACAHALARVGYRDAVMKLVPALVDPQPEVRAGVAQALGNVSGEQATALLYFKLLSGDSHADVLGACMAGLLRSAPDQFLHLVSAYLHDEDDRVAEASALALGESREPAAVDALIRVFDGGGAPRVQGTILLAIALLRQTVGTDFLLAVLEKESDVFAAHALAALAIVRHMGDIEPRVRAIVEQRKSKRLHELLVEKFEA